MNTHGLSRLMLCAVILTGCAVSRPAAPNVSPLQPDPHYTPAGFFDGHVCQWPERPLFFKWLVSSTQYDQLDKIEVFSPGGKLLGRFDLSQFRVTKHPGKPEKRMYLVDTPVPENAPDGWYYAMIRTKSGQTYQARDHIEIGKLVMAGDGVAPANDATLTVPPRELAWGVVPGARYYQAFVHDAWNDEKLIYQSPLLTQPRVTLPAGLLKPDGVYLWRVHSRDMNGDPKYGDFNLGSLSAFVSFSVQDSQ
jgi:hypothetical protein